jgi:hypothetical protein
MADELKVAIGAKYVKGSHKDSFGTEVTFMSVPRLLSTGARYDEALYEPTGIDVTGFRVQSSVVVVGSGEGSYTFDADMENKGWLFLQNIESAPSGDYVTYGPQSGGSMVSFGRLEAGESAAFRMEPSGVTMGWQAGSGLLSVQDATAPEAKIRFTLFED